MISTSNIRNTAMIAGGFQPSTFELSIPASGLMVDSPTLRRRYGGDFSSQPSAGAVSETRTNMLGSAMGALQVAERRTI